jgi:hypothetical protein
MNAKRKGPDWMKTGTIVAMSEWLRKNSNALCVVVIRRDDSSMAVAEGMPARDIPALLDEHLAALVADLEPARKEKRPAARAELGELKE